nr:MAG: ORF1 [Torque teno midi virus]
MPFWWKRRSRWWWGRRRRRPFKRYRYKRRKRRFNRRPNRRTYRRRRRRGRKVRKKRKKIHIQQWQPATIRKCKIKGWTVNCLGGHGRQFACYTDNRFNWVPPTTPGGGGFGCEKYTLGYLYDEYTRGNNIWTTSNLYLDLARYTGCKWKFFRHPYIDFVVYYKRSYPMNLEKYTYTDCYPYNLLKRKHKKIVHSLKHRPFGKPYVIIKIKPPQQMSTKWFFQETIAETGLVQIQTAATDLYYSYLGCCNTNQLVTIPILNRQFYQLTGWGNASHLTTFGWYMPWGNAPKNFTWSGTDVFLKKQSGSMNIPTDSTPEKGQYLYTTNYNTGWFQSKLISIFKMDSSSSQQVAPVKLCRYNPTRDTGIGNKVWLLSTLNTSYEPPKTDKELIIEGQPLYMLLYGFCDYVQKHKKDPTFLRSYYIVIQSDFIEPHSGLDNYHIPIDFQFLKGKGPYGETPDSYMLQHWFPRLEFQQECINNIVTSGPYIPKLDNQKNSTWELHSTYTFYFKWGGAELPEQETANPRTQGQYEVPDKLQQAIQIADPQAQQAKRNLHAWDFRRGILTKTAAKRILQDSETDSTISTDSQEEIAKKKKKLQGNSLQITNQQEEEVQTSLLSLFEENTSQEAPETDLKQLIKHQKLKQQQLKHNLLTIISDLKKKQKMIQLQTGFLD